MTWIFSRALLAVAAIALGGLVGYLDSELIPVGWVASLVSVSAAVALMILVDGFRARRLIHWLHGDQEDSPPNEFGLWGELGYRIERAVRDRDRTIQQERNELLQMLTAIEASPNGVLMLDAEDHIRWCNRVAGDHFSLNPERDRQQRITNLVRYPAFVSYLQAGQFAAPLILMNTRGKATLSVVVSPYGNGMKLVLSVDVTESERAEGMRRDFVANVSHEIRTPLTVLSGFIETMGSLPLTESERRRVLVLMGQQTQRMQTLVSDLLTLAQLEGSPRPASDRWVKLDGLLARVLSDGLALSAGRHQLEVFTQTHLEVAAVETELYSAIANLVTNAVRYTPEGGQIQLSWRRTADGGGEVCVADTGVGIAREHLPRLTERFYRVDGSRSRDTGGTGLGLSIVKHVIHRHGGELLIQSEPGKGSKFRLTLPAMRLRELEEPPHAPAAPAIEHIGT
ncbi:MAG: phosphate regulon sensor histidine kinase PhoR [Paucibacter sp.]|nr:phosphate regulon sensor histidine kinase PhoR [Roseateles sp.]